MAQDEPHPREYTEHLSLVQAELLTNARSKRTQGSRQRAILGSAWETYARSGER